MIKSSPIDPFIEENGILILDGGLATELEKEGYNLNTHLWSADLLDSNPEAIRKVHLSYLKAGADCITTASYQASIPGFISKGFSEKKANSLLKRSVDLANNACDEYMELSSNSKLQRMRPIVAASIGPYGAYLADGSEYRGIYGIKKSQLRAFHESRWEVLSGSSINLIACETIPDFEEAEVLLDMLRQTPDIFAWISFSCRDYKHISDGTLIKECAALFKDCEQVVAVGINCTDPKYVSSLISQVLLGAPCKPVIVYPNLGNSYDVETRSWVGKSDTSNFCTTASDWYKRGAKLVGGCCQVGPEHIQAMRAALIDEKLG